MTQTLTACLALSGALALSSCSPPAGAPAPAHEPGAIATVAALAQTQPTDAGEINSSVVVRDASDPARSRILATAALGGLE
ncbi:MAG: hypothetical protein KA196_04550, partial [Arenimonas sp.]|nr:hypothetical protein [Arenimonas sp.]